MSSRIEAVPVGNGSCVILGDGPAVEEGVGWVDGERMLETVGGPAGGVVEPVVAYCFNSASHLANLSCKS